MLIAKQFAKFLNRVGSQETDFLGSFLVESEWEQYIKDAEEVLRSLEASGFVVMPAVPTDQQVAQSDVSASLNKGASSPRAQGVYVRLVFQAIIEAWNQTKEDNQVVLDIFSMAISRAAEPSSKRDTGYVDSSFRRFTKNSMECVKEMEKAGYVILPEEPTPPMIVSAQRATAESRDSRTAMGAEPKYLRSLYENLVTNRPQETRPGVTEIE